MLKSFWLWSWLSTTNLVTGRNRGAVSSEQLVLLDYLDHGGSCSGEGEFSFLWRRWSFSRYPLSGLAIQVSWGPPGKRLSINQVLTHALIFSVVSSSFSWSVLLVLCITLSAEVIYKKAEIRKLKTSWTVRSLFKAHIRPSCRWYCFGIPIIREDGSLMTYM